MVYYSLYTLILLNYKGAFMKKGNLENQDELDSFNIVKSGSLLKILKK